MEGIADAPLLAGAPFGIITAMKPRYVTRERYCAEYMRYLGVAKTERRSYAESIRLLKAKGFRVIVLSNMSKEYIEFLRRMPVYRHLTEDIISCECGFVKPEREIYELLLSRYGLRPEDTIFIDDRAENVEAAAELGIAPFLFDRCNAEASCDGIRKILGIL